MGELKGHCERVRKVLQRTSVVLQDVLLLESIVQSKVAQPALRADASMLRTDPTTRCSEDVSAFTAPPTTVSQSLIELISDLSALSVDMNVLAREQQQRESDIRHNLRLMKDLITRQQQEIVSLTKVPKVMIDAETDMSELTREQTERQREKDLVAVRTIHSLEATGRNLQRTLERSTQENRKLKLAVQKSTTLLRAQEALLEEYEAQAAAAADAEQRLKQIAYSRPQLDIFDKAKQRGDIAVDDMQAKETEAWPPVQHRSIPFRQVTQTTQYNTANDSAAAVSSRLQRWGPLDSPKPTEEPPLPISDRPVPPSNPVLSISRLRTSPPLKSRYESDTQLDQDGKNFKPTPTPLLVESSATTSMSVGDCSCQNDSCYSQLEDSETSILPSPSASVLSPNVSTTSIAEVTAERGVPQQSPGSQSQSALDCQQDSLRSSSISHISPIVNQSRDTLTVSGDSHTLRPSEWVTNASLQSMGESFMLVQQYYDSYFSNPDASSASFVDEESNRSLLSTT